MQEVLQADIAQSALGSRDLAPKFKSSDIYVVTYILKKTVFILFQAFSCKIRFELERFHETRNQRISSSPTMVGQGLGSSDNLCILEPVRYLAPPKFKSCISPCYGLI